MRFGESVFYNTRGLSIAEKSTLLNDCKDVSYEWRADILDCSVSMSRKKIDCSFEDILKRLKESTHFVVIDRGTWGSPIGEDREHFEIGFRTMDSSVDYFLFIEVDSENMPPIIDKYNLLPIEQTYSV